MIYRILYIVLLMHLGAFASSLRAQDVVVPDPPTCDECVISEELSVTLGTPDGPGALGEVNRVFTDRQGRFWVVSPGPETPMLFNEDGVFLQRVGKLGEGPGEFRGVLSVWDLPADSIGLWVGNGVHVYNRDLKFVRSMRLVLPATARFLLLEWPRLAVLNADIRTPERAGLPLHLVDFSYLPPRINRSFGSQDGGMRLPISGARAMRQVLAASSRNQGDWWATPANSYRVTERDGRGVELLTLIRRPDWFPGVSNLLEGGPKKPPSPKMVGLYEDDRGLLWTFALVASPDYGRAWPRVQPPVGTVRGTVEFPASEIDWQLLYHTRIEVLDPRSGTLVAGHTLERVTTDVLSDGRVATVASGIAGTPRVEVYRLLLGGR